MMLAPNKPLSSPTSYDRGYAFGKKYAPWILAGMLAGAFFVGKAHAAQPINLPGEVLGGVELCNMRGECSDTFSDNSTTARVISYDQNKGTLVAINGEQFFVTGNQVSLTYKGCRMSLASYVLRSFCDGKPWPK